MDTQSFFNKFYSKLRLYSLFHPMTQEVILYIIIGAIAALAIFAFSIGSSKMIKIVLGNYILSSICLAAFQSIALLINTLQANPIGKFAGMSNETLIKFFTNGQTTIVLGVYVILLVIMYRSSKIQISLPSDEAARRMLQIILVPLTVISIILTLQIALMGMNIGNILMLQELASKISSNPYIFNFFSMTPLWILIHGIATIIITSEMKISVKTDLD